MKVIGITGGIGSGKSTVMYMLEKAYGAVIILADKLGHLAMEKDSSTYKKMVSAFGIQILDCDGQIDRVVLADILMADKEKLSIQNDIVHPFVIDRIKDKIEESRVQEKKLVCVESAILFEAGCDVLCDEVWLVTADPDVRVERLMRDRGYDRNKAYAFMNRQKPDSYYAEKCSRIIYNNGDIENLSKQLQKHIEESMTM